MKGTTPPIALVPLSAWQVEQREPRNKVLPFVMLPRPPLDELEELEELLEEDELLEELDELLLDELLPALRTRIELSVPLSTDEVT